MQPSRAPLHQATRNARVASAAPFGIASGWKRASTALTPLLDDHHALLRKHRNVGGTTGRSGAPKVCDWESCKTWIRKHGMRRCSEQSNGRAKHKHGRVTHCCASITRVWDGEVENWVKHTLLATTQPIQALLRYLVPCRQSLGFFVLCLLAKLSQTRRHLPQRPTTGVLLCIASRGDSVAPTADSRSFERVLGINIVPEHASRSFSAHRGVCLRCCSNGTCPSPNARWRRVRASPTWSAGEHSSFDDASDRFCARSCDSAAATSRGRIDGRNLAGNHAVQTAKIACRSAGRGKHAHVSASKLRIRGAKARCGCHR